MGTNNDYKMYNKAVGLKETPLISQHAFINTFYINSTLNCVERFYLY